MPRITRLGRHGMVVLLAADGTKLPIAGRDGPAVPAIKCVNLLLDGQTAVVRYPCLSQTNQIFNPRATLSGGQWEREDGTRGW
jgi:hypothetical protein